MHKITTTFLQGIDKNLEDYELLYKYRMFYSEWSSKFYALERKRKPLKAAIYNELRNTIKSQKDAEMQTEASQAYNKHIEQLCEARQISLESYALLSGLEAKMDALRSKQISANLEKKLNSPQGYGS
jgi:hypothetical protein